MFANPFEIEEIVSLGNLMPAYEFDHLIALGSMGAVYKARQRSLDRDVAIKILRRELGDDPLFRSSFEAEAKAMARLTHPNLIRIYDSGDMDGLLYIVMEYVHGKSLHHSAHGKAIDSVQAVEIVIAVSRGLAHAHENGIIHRDIKPANILLTPKLEPKIGDFGLARCTRVDVDGLAMGTPEYMAPEVLNNPVRGNPQSDVFAIGMVLRELLTGTPAGTEGAAERVISDPKLASICQTATHPNLALRYPDASSLAEQLTQWMTLKTSQPAVTTKQPTILRPLPIAQRPRPASQAQKPAHTAKHGSSPKWALLKCCASITFVLCSSYLIWGVYQTRQLAITRQQQEQNNQLSTNMLDPEPNAAAPSTASGDLVTTPSASHQESSFESLLRFGTALIAGNDR